MGAAAVSTPAKKRNQPGIQLPVKLVAPFIRFAVPAARRYRSAYLNGIPNGGTYAIVVAGTDRSQYCRTKARSLSDTRNAQRRFTNVGL